MTMQTIFYKDQYIQLSDSQCYVTFNKGMDYNTIKFKSLLSAKRGITKYNNNFDKFVEKYSIETAHKFAIKLLDK